MKTIKYIAVACLLALSFFPSAVFSAGYTPDQQNVPVVVLERFKPPGTPSLHYLGQALTEMIKIRLESQGIDVIQLDQADQEKMAALASIADLLMTGRIQEENGVVDLEVDLLRLGGSEQLEGAAARPLKVWHVKSQDLGMLAQKTSLLSGQIADAVRSSHELMLAEAEKARKAEAGEDEASPEEEGDLELARMHPDRLVRERLAMDQEKERQRAIEEAKKGAKEMKEDTRYWDPLPSPYYSENEELLEQDYHPEPIGGKEEQQEGQEGSGSWWSRLWPWGGDEKEAAEGEQSSTYEAVNASEVDLEDVEEAHQPLVVPRDKLPVPPPKPVDFTIPEPQSVDEVLRSATLVKRDKKKEEKWYSFLIPWGDDTDDYDIILNKTDLGQEKAAEGAPPGPLADSAATSMVVDQFVDNIAGTSPAAGPADQTVAKPAAAGTGSTDEEIGYIDSSADQGQPGPPPADEAERVLEQTSQMDHKGDSDSSRRRHRPLWQWE